MNCPQCETANGLDAAFCARCGTRLAPADAPTGTGGQFAATGAQPGADPGATSAGYGAAGGYSAAPGSTPPSYGPAGGQAPGYQGPYPQGAPGPHPQRSPSSGLPPVNFDLNRLTTIDKIVAGATLITAISIWLPWYTFDYGYGYAYADYGYQPGVSVSFSGLSVHGWLWLEFIVALVLLAYLAARVAWDKFPVNIPVAHAPLLIIGTALQLLLILVAFADIPYGGQGMGLNWAAFIGLFGALAAVGPVAYPVVKSYLDSRKVAGPGAS